MEACAEVEGDSVCCKIVKTSEDNMIEVTREEPRGVRDVSAKTKNASERKAGHFCCVIKNESGFLSNSFLPKKNCSSDGSPCNDVVAAVEELEDGVDRIRQIVSSRREVSVLVGSMSDLRNKVVKTSMLFSGVTGFSADGGTGDIETRSNRETFDDVLIINCRARDTPEN